jgi:hypothetical protein
MTRPYERDLALMTMLSAGVFTLGTDGTHGIGKAVLTGWIRLYRLIPVPVRRRLHPQPGSSAAGLAAARAGLGSAGVAAAISRCGCMR